MKNEFSLSCILSLNITLICDDKRKKKIIPFFRPALVFIWTQPAGGTLAENMKTLSDSPFSFHLSFTTLSQSLSPHFSQHLIHLIPQSQKRLRAYQADVVVQQLQGEERFQSQLIETRLRQTCQKQSSHNKSSPVNTLGVSGREQQAPTVTSHGGGTSRCPCG